MKRNYSSLEFEIIEEINVVATSSEVESEKIPLSYDNNERSFDL